MVILGECGHGIGGPRITEEQMAEALDSGRGTSAVEPWRVGPQARETFGPHGIRTKGHPNIFPNLWIALGGMDGRQELERPQGQSLPLPLRSDLVRLKQESLLLQYEVEQFYYAEAALLDERKFDEWLDLLTTDVHYWMPIRRTVMLADLDQEFTKPGGMAFFDDDKAMLEARVKKLDTGYSWSEDPPSRTRHMIFNVRILEPEGDDLDVEANFHLYRTRLESEEDSWFGRRLDRLRRADANLKIARRHVSLEQTVILSRNMSNFF